MTCQRCAKMQAERDAAEDALMELQSRHMTKMQSVSADLLILVEQLNGAVDQTIAEWRVVSAAANDEDDADGMDDRTSKAPARTVRPPSLIDVVTVIEDERNKLHRTVLAVAAAHHRYAQTGRGGGAAVDAMEAIEAVLRKP